MSPVHRVSIVILRDLAMTYQHNRHIKLSVPIYKIADNLNLSSNLIQRVSVDHILLPGFNVLDAEGSAAAIL
jgi:hypothetical protein